MVRFKKALLLSALTAVTVTAGAQMNPKEKMAAALKAIQENYVDSIPDEKLADAAVIGMLKQLDPHSRYFSREDALQMRQGMSGSFYGIGIQFLIQRDTVFVTQVFADGPAALKGLMVGDRIISVDTIDVTGKQLSNMDVLLKLRGKKGEPVSLKISRKSLSEPFAVEIIRGSIPDRSVKAAYMVNDKTGYLALRIFNQTTRNEVDKALIQLKSEGMQNLILDLQGNGGGYVESAIGVADEFLQKNQLVFYSVGQDKVRNYNYTGGFGQFMSGKLVVLIDQNTASASEILSGALQDWDRAVLVGRRTFGKGLMQKPVPLPDGSVLELTGARYYTPSGRSIQKPYHGNEYEESTESRISSGELYNENVLHFPDSLKYTTLTSKRTVYGGGGIMPDKFIPIDTLEFSPWLGELSRGGWINKAVFDYVDTSRTTLQKQWPDFKAFQRGFVLPGSVLDQLTVNAQKAGVSMPQAGAARLRELLALEIKAQVASQLYSNNDFYIQVLNSDNKSFKAALEIIDDSRSYSSVLPEVPPVKKKK